MPPTSQADVQTAMIYAKIDRAKHHVANVENIAAKQVQSGFLSSFQSSKGKYIGQGKVRVFPIELITTTGDAIHNLRSALDHLAWQLSHWKKWEPTERCAFPIGRSQEHYEATKMTMVKGMSPEAQGAIDLLKPYKGGNDLLWMIHHLDIVDKHHQLFVFGYRYVVSGLRLPGTLSALTDQTPHFLGIVEGDLDGDSEESTPHVKPLVPALKEMVAYTESLIEDFKPLLAQLLERPQVLRKAVSPHDQSR